MNQKLTMALAAALLLGTQALAQNKTAFQLVNSKKVTTSEKAMNATSGGKVGADKKSLSFSSKNVKLVIRTGPDNDMMSYRIQGLRNPTLYVKAGSTLHITFANTDEDMFHNVRFGANKPPFQTPLTDAGTVGSDKLPHTKDEKAFGQIMTIKAPSKPGTYTYLCTVKGHAPAGMWGTLIVR